MKIVVFPSQREASEYLVRLAAESVMQAAETWAHQFPIHDAVRKGNLALVQDLIEYRRPTAKELEKGKKRGVKRTEDEQKSYINNRQADDQAGSTLLSIAAINKRPQVTAYLLRKGADPNVTDKFKATPLHDAALSGDVQSVISLVGTGVDINARDAANHSALYYAAKEDHIDIVEFLFEKNAHVFGEGHPVKPLLDQLSDNSVSYKFLFSKGARSEQTKTAAKPTGKVVEFEKAIRDGDHESVERLLDEGIDVNTRFEYDMTPLIVAASTDDIEMVGLLLERGADVNAESEGYSAIYNTQETDIIKLLSDHGAKFGGSKLDHYLDDFIGCEGEDKFQLLLSWAKKDVEYELSHDTFEEFSEWLQERYPHVWTKIISNKNKIKIASAYFFADKKRKTKKNWIQKMESGRANTTKIPKGTFTKKNKANDIARILKNAAPDYQAAMAMLTMYESRAGKRLTQERRNELERAKHALRVTYHRDDRIELYEKPKKKEEQEKDKKTSSVERTAMRHLMYTVRGVTHHGDMFIELLGKPDHILVARLGREGITPERFHDYEDALREHYETEDLDEVKLKLNRSYESGRNIPVFDLEGKHFRLVSNIEEEKKEKVEEAV